MWCDDEEVNWQVLLEMSKRASAVQSSMDDVYHFLILLLAISPTFCTTHTHRVLVAYVSIRCLCEYSFMAPEDWSV
jgi:hypothetical protein